MNITLEFRAAYHRICFDIDAKAEKQKRWLKAAGETMNRSIAQRIRRMRERETKRSQP